MKHARDRIHELLQRPGYRGTSAEIAAATGCSIAAAQTWLADLRASSKAKVVGTLPSRGLRDVLVWALDSDPLANLTGTVVEKALASQPALFKVWHPQAVTTHREAA